MAKRFSIKRVVVNALMLLSVLATIGLVIGLLGRWHFVPDLAAHFRPIGVLALVLAGVVFLVLKCWKLAAAFLVIAGLFSIALFPYLIPARRDTQEPDVRIMILNVLTSNPDKQSVIRYIKKAEPDVFLLMEVDYNWQLEVEKVLRDAYPHGVHQPRNDNFGISLYSKFPLRESKVVTDFGLHELPSIDTHVVLPGGKSFQFIGIHPIPPMNQNYWQSRNQQMLDVLTHRRLSIPVVVGGDFNCTPWSYHFRRFEKEAKLRDTALGRGISPTWVPSSNLGRILSLPLDHIFVSDEWSVCKRDVGPDVGSDHRGVVVELRLRADE